MKSKKSTSKKSVTTTPVVSAPAIAINSNTAPVETVAELRARLAKAQEAEKQAKEAAKAAKEAEIAALNTKRSEFAASIAAAVNTAGTVAPEQIENMVSTFTRRVFGKAGSGDKRGRGPISPETKTSIQNALKSGVKAAEIVATYGVSTAYVALLKRSLGLTKPRKAKV